jgi:hypothetical protein
MPASYGMAITRGRKAYLGEMRGGNPGDFKLPDATAWVARERERKECMDTGGVILE